MYLWVSYTKNMNTYFIESLKSLNKVVRSELDPDLDPDPDPLGPSCLLQTILLSDLVGCDSPLQIEVAAWHTIFQMRNKPNGHYYLQRAVTPYQITHQNCMLKAGGL